MLHDLAVMPYRKQKIAHGQSGLSPWVQLALIGQLAQVYGSLQSRARKGRGA